MAMRLSFVLLVAAAGVTSGAPMIDQAHDLTQSVGGVTIGAGRAPAQVFTAGAGGLLSQVDVLLTLDAGDLGDLDLEIWPVVAEGPAGRTPLLSAPITPSIASSGFVEVDVSAGGLIVEPGTQYAIAVNGSAAFGAPNASWIQGRPGYAGGDQFARSGDWRFDSSPSFDYGFRTWVDPTATGGLDFIELPLLADVQASVFGSLPGVSIDGADTIRIDADTENGGDSRGVFTFDTTALPPNADLQAARFSFDLSLLSGGSAGSPAMDLYGFTTDRPPTSVEALDLSNQLGGSGPITSIDSNTVSLDAARLESLIRQSDIVGLTAVQGGAPNQELSVFSSEGAARFGAGQIAAPRLEVGLAPSPTAPRLPDGDFNRDARVDAADYTVWRDSDGDQFGYSDWADNYGTAPLAEAANGAFEAGDLSGWQVVVGDNTNVSSGFPRIETFDVDGDGASDSAFRVRLGRANSSLFGGAVAIEQELLLEGGDYEFAADVASQSLELFGNTGPGNFELAINGVIVDQVLLNGTLIDPMAVIRDELRATLVGLQPGYHTLRLTVSRGASNTREIYQLIDNIRVTPLGGPTTVPEPTAARLVGAALLMAMRRRG